MNMILNSIEVINQKTDEAVIFTFDKGVKYLKDELRKLDAYLKYHKPTLDLPKNSELERWDYLEFYCDTNDEVLFEANIGENLDELTNKDIILTQLTVSTQDIFTIYMTYTKDNQQIKENISDKYCLYKMTAYDIEKESGNYNLYIDTHDGIIFNEFSNTDLFLISTFELLPNQEFIDLYIAI